MTVDEFDLIDQRFRPLAQSFPGALDLRDDAALIAAAPGHLLAVSADALVAGVHFFADDPPELIARKAVRVNLSDIAAMGGRVKALMLCLCLPRTASADWISRFCDGLQDDLMAFQLPLIGGDTVSTPGPLTLAVTIFGETRQGQAWHRGGGQLGDDLWVSGTIGDGAFGLLARQGLLTGLLSAEQNAFLQDRYWLPRPRLDLAARLADEPGLIHAAMDISDGLLADLGHLCAASGVGAEIWADRVPLSAAGRAALDAGLGEGWTTVLAGGDDYELLMSASPEQRQRLDALSGQDGLPPLTRIGCLRAGQDVRLLDAEGRALLLNRRGYRHQSGA